MAGQKDWKNRGAPNNEFIVNPELEDEIYIGAEWATVFAGQLNNRKILKVTEVDHRGGTVELESGNDAVVWNRTIKRGTEIRFTLREENRGMTTFGEADVRTGDFAMHKHVQGYTRQHDTPAYPIVGVESQANAKEVYNDYISAERRGIMGFIAKEIDLDHLRAAFMGASRALLSTADGGMGIELPGGGAAGQWRAPWNTLVAGSGGLTTQVWNTANHNAALGSALQTLVTTSPLLKVFSYQTHVEISAMINKLNMQPFKVRGDKYRAVALIDEWNLYSLRSDPEFRSLFSQATERSDKNLSVFSRGALVLDDILYLPMTQLSFFRPTVASNVITSWGAGFDKDPRSSAFVNNSPICPTLVMGRGALLRCQRPVPFNITVENGRHSKGVEYSGHWTDGVVRTDWRTEDGRQEMYNDSMLAVFNYGVSPVKTI